MVFRILAAGDATIDEFLLFLPPAKKMTQAEDWKRHSSYISCSDTGGNCLTEKGLIALAPRSVAIERLDVPRGGEGKEQILRSLVELACIKDDKAKPGDTKIDSKPTVGESTYKTRIKRFRGYSSEIEETPPKDVETKRKHRYDVVVLNDSLGGLRKSKVFADALPKLLTQHGVIVHKCHVPLHKTSDLAKVFDAVARQKSEIDRGRCILHVSAQDLRMSGVKLDADLDWSVVVDDLFEATRKGRFLDANLQRYGAIVVQIGEEGAALLQRSEVDAHTNCILVHDPRQTEGSVSRSQPGDMIGLMNAFLCSLVMSMVKERKRQTPLAITANHVMRALAASRAWSRDAFTLRKRKGAWVVETPTFTSPKIDDAKEQLVATEFNFPEPKVASFQHSFTEKGLDDLAREIVIDGMSAITKLPHATFGDLQTIDRDEIKSYRQIERAIRQYINTPSREKPLSLAVFGAPGSGKSFGLKQIIADMPIREMEFNLSEIFADDLPGYFQEVRDIKSDGKIPLCFFDEFDRNNFELVPRFLAPMQDGQFRDSGRTHPIGRAIFVFAGGICANLEDFRNGVGLMLDDPKQDAAALARQLKVPDFVSRLEGVIEIKGLDTEEDEEVVLRRAVLLRGILSRFAKTAVMDSDKKAIIQSGLLEALLKVAEYRFGVRSMEKIVTMSKLSGSARGWSVSDLPSRQLLELHLKNPDTFLDHIRNSTKVGKAR